MEVQEIRTALKKERPEIPEQMRQNLQLLIGQVSELNKYPQEICKKYFKLGKVAHRCDNVGFKMQEVAAIANINQKEIYLARKMVKIYDGDETKFDDDLKRLKPRSWTHFKKLIGIDTTKQRKLKSKEIDVIRMLHCMIVDWKKSKDQGTYLELTKVRDMLIKQIGFGKHIQDKNFLKFSECCCCGIEPTHEGHKLKYYKNITGILYPICPDCDMLNAHPDPDRIIFNYAHYSIGLERIIDTINQ